MEVAKQYPSIHHPNNFYTKRFGELCFFVLDTTIFDKLYYFHKRGSQIRWLKDKVKEYKGDCKFSIAVAHHPLFSSGDRDRANPQLAIFWKDIYLELSIFTSQDTIMSWQTKEIIKKPGNL